VEKIKAVVAQPFEAKVENSWRLLSIKLIPEERSGIEPENLP